MDETIYYLETANGEIMRVPESKLEEFQAMNECLKAGSCEEEKVSQNKKQVLTENQILLARYLTVIGCSKATVFHIVGELWDEEAVIEMLEFCRDNHPASQDALLKASSEIYSKYKDRIEAIPEA